MFAGSVISLVDGARSLTEVANEMGRLWGFDSARILEQLRAFFNHWHDRGKIIVNVAKQLEPFKIPDPAIHVYTAEQVMMLFDKIPETFPKIAAEVEAFLLTQMFTAFRISDVVTLETVPIIARIASRFSSIFFLSPGMPD